MSPRRSVRAATRAVYEETRRGHAPPVPPRVAARGPRATPLMARVRALYEKSAVPVAEIARLCGVAERTVYKYAAKGGWQKRYNTFAHRRALRGDAAGAARASRASRTRLLRGPGGRFLAHKAAGKKISRVRGLKATDPEGRRRASAACAAALAAEAEARKDAERMMLMEQRCRALGTAVRALEQKQRHLAGLKPAALRTPQEEEAVRALTSAYDTRIGLMCDLIDGLKRHGDSLR